MKLTRIVLSLICVALVAGCVGQSQAHLTPFAAFEFDGTQASAPYHETSTSFDLSSDFSISAWVKVPPNVRSNAIIARVGPGGRSWELALSSDGNLIWYNDGSIRATSVPHNLKDGEWHSVVVVGRSGGTISLYIDGVPSGGNNVIAWTNSQRIYIGSDNYGGDNAFPAGGQIADVRMWTNTALNSSQIDKIYNLGNGTMSSVGGESHWYRGSIVDLAGGVNLEKAPSAQEINQQLATMFPNCPPELVSFMNSSTKNEDVWNYCTTNAYGQQCNSMIGYTGFDYGFKLDVTATFGGYSFDSATALQRELKVHCNRGSATGQNINNLYCYFDLMIGKTDIDSGGNILGVTAWEVTDLALDNSHNVVGLTCKQHQQRGLVLWS